MMFCVLYLFGQKMRREQQGRQAKNGYDRNRFLRISFGHFPGKHSVVVVSLLYSVEQFICTELKSARNIKFLEDSIFKVQFF